MNMEFEIEVGADAEDIGDIQAFQNASTEPARRERSNSAPKQVQIKVPPGGSGPGAMIALEDMSASSDISPTRIRRFSDGSNLASLPQPPTEIMSLCDGRTDSRLASYLTEKRGLFGSSSMEDVGSISRKAHVRAVVQQCSGAQLTLPPASHDLPPETVEVGSVTYRNIMINVYIFKI
jgi:hypothetical protein